MSGKAQKLGRLPFVILGALAALLIGVAALLQVTVADTREELSKARKSYETMYGQKMDVLKEPVRGSIDPPANIDTTLVSFFTQIRQTRGIRDEQMPVSGTTPIKTEVPETNWTKHSVNVQFKGTKEAPLDKRKLVEFLDDVEKSKYLKATRLILRFPDGVNIQDAQVTISYYKRKE